jgi:hypothetical protein
MPGATVDLALWMHDVLVLLRFYARIVSFMHGPEIAS